jgi:hypothetical protein
MATPEETRAVLKRLFEDFPFYAEKVLRIRTKTGKIEPLKLNEAQRRLIEAADNQWSVEGKVRIIVLKARQMGLSTAIGGWIYHKVSMRPAERAIVVTHHADSTKALFDMTKRFYDQTPEAIRPSTKYSSRKELVFDRLDSGYVVATAGGESVGRGQTIRFAHKSEVAFWPPAKAREQFNGLLQTIPDAPGTAIFIESTANGVSGLFWETWQGAVKGENGFIPVFLPWFIQDEYRLEPPKNFRRSPEEEKLHQELGLDDHQLAWRRRKIAEVGRDLFMQEYPSTPDEAFLTSGRPVFNPELVGQMIADSWQPIHRLALEGDEWEKHSRGELSVWFDWDPSETYYIGADVAEGVRGGDYSVAQVLDSKKRLVASWRGHIDPDSFGDVLFHLGKLYNEAEICVESNNHGLTTLTRLIKALQYPNAYTEVIVDKISDTETVKMGLSINSRTKPLVVDGLRQAFRELTLEIRDPTTLRELQTFVVKDNGKMEAEEGCHDDCVMSLALANFVHKGSFTPIENQGNWYVSMV